MAEVVVRYFAKARELSGTAEERIDLPALTDTESIAQVLATRHPALQRLLSCSRLAVRLAFAKGAVELQDGDEVAVIPPVSGG